MHLAGSRIQLCEAAVWKGCPPLSAPLFDTGDEASRNSPPIIAEGKARHATPVVFPLKHYTNGHPLRKATMQKTVI